MSQSNVLSGSSTSTPAPLPSSALPCSPPPLPPQRTADFLTTNKLGHCLLWDTSSSSRGSAGSGGGSSSDSSPSNILPPLPTQAARYEPGSEAFKVGGCSSWVGCGAHGSGFIASSSC